MKVSIVIPVYNVENYLERCVGSVQSQTYKNLEIICINDGSTDGSWAVLQELSVKDDRIKLINQENQGLSITRNVGIKESTGDYIYFLDSDDYLEKETIELLALSAEKDKVDIAICGIRYISSERTDSKSVDRKIILSGENSAIAYYQNKFDMEPMVWNKLYKKDIFHEIMFEERKLHEDKYFTPRVLIYANMVSFIPYVGYNYILDRSDSITNKKFNRNNLDGLNSSKENAKFFKQKQLRRLALYASFKYYLDLPYYYCLFHNSDKQITREIYDEANKNKINIFKKGFALLEFRKTMKIFAFIVAPKTYYKYWSRKNK